MRGLSILRMGLALAASSMIVREEPERPSSLWSPHPKRGGNNKSTKKTGYSEKNRAKAKAARKSRQQQRRAKK